ncbi:hexamerin-like [Schistocerca gregaria]|uniref:hexamerin-like n=1 Tax=Schistocerca gregaria TaxID=7010 RepID=UPI00211EC6EC|nr:hexamerin-like [Schistocerca gregaria]
MGATTVALLVILAAAAAVPKRQTPEFDQVQQTRQKNILRLLTRYRQPPLWEDMAAIAGNYTLQPENYQVPELVEDFVQRKRSGEFLAFDEPTSVLEDSDVDQIKLFVDLLYHSKDYDTFYKTAVYLRETVNKAQFIISFLISVKMRQDTKDFLLPPLFEIRPELFITSDVIQQVYDLKMRGGLRPLDVGQYYILSNHTQYRTVHTPEEKLSYFTEDVWLNEYFADLNYRYPYFLSASNYTLTNGDVRGDVFYHTLRHLYARYFLERLSHGLPEVAPLSCEKGVPTGYNPQLKLLNGVELHLRPKNQNLLDADAFALQRIRYSEYRLYEMVDTGYVVSATGGRKRYKQSEATNILGNLIQGTADSIHPRYYGALYKDLLSLIGRYDPTQRYGLAASVLGKYETMLRDPVFFQIVKRILNIFEQYQNYLEPYTRKELEFPGLKIESLEVDRLVTYFDGFDLEVDNSLKASSTEEIEKIKIFASKQRLNHKPFTYRIKVFSEKPTKAIFRTFYGPRYDSYGNEMTLDEARQYFVEIDRFVYELVAGENDFITRSSSDFVSAEYGSLYMARLQEVVELALQGRGDYSPASEFRLGFPDGLLLPRGAPGGLPLRVYVIASPLPRGVPAAQVAGPRAPIAGDWFVSLADGRPVAFPFDRRIPHTHNFRVPNSYTEDVTVHQGTIDD